MGNVTPTVEQFFESYSPEVRETALRARELVLSIVPGAVEKTDTGHNIMHVGTGPKMADEVFYVSAHKANANVGLMGGADVPDPAGLMEGTGKRLRHVKLHSPGEVDNPALRVLLEDAYTRHMERAQGEAKAR